MKIRVHVKGVKGSGPPKEGEEADVLFSGALEIDGMLLDRTGEIKVHFDHNEIATVVPILYPGSFEVVTHNTETWDELFK